MKTRDFRVQAGGKSADLWIYEEIDDWWGVSAMWVRNQLEAHKGIDTIDLHLNSPGGMVTESAAIYNLLRNHAASVIVHVEGLAASGASLIAMAGDEIVIYEAAMFMIHGAWSVTRGFAQDHRDTAELLEKMSETMANAYAARTRQPRDVVQQKMAAETWFTAEEALAFGLADRMVAGKEKLAASFDLARFQFKHVPEAFAKAEPKAQQLTLPVAPAPEPTVVEEQNMKAICKALGLSEDATEGEIVAAINERDKEHGRVQAHVKALEDVIGKTGPEAVGAAKAHVESTAKLAALADKVANDERASLIAKAKAEGKITPAELDYWKKQPVESLRAYLEVASAKVPTGEFDQPGAGNGGDPKPAALTYQGKTYAELDGRERAALKSENRELFDQMRNAWRDAGFPAADDSKG